MLNSTASPVPGDGSQPRSPDVIYVSPSSPALTSVIACMAIMAVCAVAYFFIRWHFEEKRLKASLALCKCPTAASAVCNSNIEFGTHIPPACRYSERRAISVGVQANMNPQPPASVSYWATSDVRVSEARRTGCKFSSPLPNNQAVPDWRPPATGSSNRPHYPFTQRRRPIPPHRRRRGTLSMPSVNVQSASSSDSYSLLTMSHNSRSAALNNRDLTAATFSDEEQQNLCVGVGCSSSRLEVHSTSPGYHPRYNTPVSETNEQETAVAVEEEAEEGEGEEEENENDEREVDEGEDLERGHRKRRSSSEDDAAAGRPSNGQLKGMAMAVVSSTTTADGVTQSSSTFGYVGGNLKSSQMPGSSNCMNSASGIGLFHHHHHQQHQHQLDTVRYTLPNKGSFPSCEYLPGGRLVTRWTQTDNGAPSLVSLDWDNYDSERLRSVSVDVCGLHDVDDDEDEGLRSSSAYHDGDGEETRTLLMASHTTASDLTLQASHTSRTSTSSPYVICFECNEEFSLNGNRRPRRNILNSLDQQLSRSSPLTTHDDDDDDIGGLSSLAHGPTVPNRVRRKSLAPAQDLHK